jgi:hypothetical protein
VSFMNPSRQGDAHFSQAFEKRIFQTPAQRIPYTKTKIDELHSRKSKFYPFWLTSDVNISLPIAGVQDVNFSVNKNIWFLALGIMCRAISTGSMGYIDEKFTVRIFDPATTRELCNNQLLRTVCSGTSDFPHWLPTGWLLEPNSLIRGQFTNLVLDAVTDVYFTFYGIAAEV